MKSFNFMSLLVFLFPLLFLATGCADKMPEIRKHKISEYTKVGLAIQEHNISVQNNIYTGVVMGAGQTIGECIKGTPSAGAGHPLALIIMPIFCPIWGLTVGSVSGAIASSKLKKIKEKKGSIQSRIDTWNVAKKLSDVAVEYMNEHAINTMVVNSVSAMENDYRVLALRGINTVLELDNIAISFEQVGVDNIPVMMILEAESRLVDTKDGKILSKSKWKMFSNFHRYKSWVNNDFKLLQREYDGLVGMLIGAIVDEHLLLYYPTLPKETEFLKVKRHVPYHVLSPYEPELDFTGWGKAGGALRIPFALPKQGSGLKDTWNVVVELKEEKPFFKWELFPLTHDTVDKTLFSDIVYDFEIYKYKDSLVYTRKGLKENRHQLEEPLEKDVTYLWTVRARFKYNGKPRVTEWGCFYKTHIVEKGVSHRELPIFPMFYGYYPFMIEED